MPWELVWSVFGESGVIIYPKYYISTTVDQRINDLPWVMQWRVWECGCVVDVVQSHQTMTPNKYWIKKSTPKQKQWIQGSPVPCNSPMQICNTMVRVCRMPWCVEIQYCTHTCNTHFRNSTGLPIPVLNPSGVKETSLAEFLFNHPNDKKD